MQEDLRRQDLHEPESQHPHSPVLTGGSDAICNWILRLFKCIYQFLLCVYTLF